MKKGLLIYPHNDANVFNIGDYIQSLAAKQFIGAPDEYINRESMNLERNEDIALIANGWYMHHPENWPPNEKIKPLYVALHINKLAEDRLLSTESINYFKKIGPIGCRDYYTTNKLLGKGVDAYFSGCLTLTLGNTYKNKGKDNTNIYFTDLNSHAAPSLKFYLKCIYNFVFKHSLIKEIQKRKEKCGIKSKKKNIVAFYSTFSNIIEDELFLNAIYKEQEIQDTFNSEEEKFQYADELLKVYSEARFVITSRIHCALPCLAMGTPVLFVHNENLGIVHNCRMDGLVQLFRTINIKGDKVKCELLSKGKKISNNFLFSNKEDYKILLDKLKHTCRDFVIAITE